MAIVINHFSGSFRILASSSVRESLRFTFAAHFTPYIRRDSCNICMNVLIACRLQVLGSG